MKLCYRVHLKKPENHEIHIFHVFGTRLVSKALSGFIA